MKVGILLFPVALLFSGALIAQDDDQPAPSSHPAPDTIENTIPEPKHNDAPLLSAYGRANQLKYLIEPDIDIGTVNGEINIGIAPTVGHKIYKGLYAGAGAVFIYSGVSNALIDVVNGQFLYASAHSYTYGGGVYVHYTIWKGLYIRARVDLLHRQIEDIVQASVNSNAQTGAMEVKVPVLKINAPDVPLSVGYNILANKNLFLPISVSYNLLYPFQNKQLPVYPGGIVVQVCVLNIF